MKFSLLKETLFHMQF